MVDNSNYNNLFKTIVFSELLCTEEYFGPSVANIYTRLSFDPPE